MKRNKIRLVLEDGSSFMGESFGYPASTTGEVVFNTGMTGYPESLTDPSYFGQILVLTYPLIGNYGVPHPSDSFEQPAFESDHIQVRALVVADYSKDFSHWKAEMSLAAWLHAEKIPAIANIDTRYLTRLLREKGTMLGKIVLDSDPEFYDPNRENLVRKVSISAPEIIGSGKQRVALLDCGCKNSIISAFVERGIEVLRLPWDADVRQHEFDALFISNGPGDPKTADATIDSIKWALQNDVPTMGICLGHQLLALAAGANTYKLKYGHRSQNQPVIDTRSRRCLVTSQNHGFAVDAERLPDGWQAWFTNLNDGTNEGIVHESGRFMSVQFHPEAAPGPEDARYIFDRFLEIIKS